MKILFVTPYLPSPPRFGAQRRLDGLMRGLAARHEVSLLSYTTSGADAEAATRSYCRDVRTLNLDLLATDVGRKRLLQLRSIVSRRSFEALLYHQPDFQTLLDRTLASTPYDVVQFEFSQMGIYQLARAARRPCFVLDEHNVEYEIVKRTAETEGGALRRFYSSINWRKQQQEELDCWRRFDGVALTSKRDEEIVQAEAPQVRTVVVPNAVDLEAFRPNDTQVEPATLLFFGAMNYHPNIEGVHFFLDEILPLVRARRPDVKFVVVGQSPPESVLARRTPGVEITGFVDDPRPYVDRATVMVVPLRIGGGTRFKIVEGMAKAKAIVSTRIGAEGLDVEHERQLLLADTPSDFAREIDRLIEDRDLRVRLGHAARKLAEERYGWARAVATLEGFYDRLLA